jgi:hypothetical protein
MAKRDALKDVPNSSFVGKPGKPSGAGLKPANDYLRPAGRKPEPPTGTIDWRSDPEGQAER